MLQFADVGIAPTLAGDPDGLRGNPGTLTGNAIPVD